MTKRSLLRCPSTSEVNACQFPALAIEPSERSDLFSESDIHSSRPDRRRLTSILGSLCAISLQARLEGMHRGPTRPEHQRLLDLARHDPTCDARNQACDGGNTQRSADEGQV